MAQVKIQSDFNGNAIINGINYLSSGLQMEVNAVNPNNIDLKYMNRRIYFDIPYYDYTNIAGQPLGTDVTTTIQAMDALFDDSVFFTTIVGFGGIAGGSGTYSSQGYAAWLQGKSYLGGNTQVQGTLNVSGGTGSGRSSIKNLDISSNPLEETNFISGYQTQYGASINLSEGNLSYFNTGYHTKLRGGASLPNGNVVIEFPSTPKPNTPGAVYTMTVSGDASSPALEWTDISSLGSSPWTESGNDIYYNTGNVGIGTTAPESSLHIAGTTGITMGRNSVQNQVARVYADAGDNLILTANSGSGKVIKLNNYVFGNSIDWSFTNSTGNKLDFTLNPNGWGGSNPPSLASFNSSVGYSTGDWKMVKIENTLNQTGDAAFTDLFINRTENSTGTGNQLFIDAQTNSVSKFSVDSQGKVTPQKIRFDGTINNGVTFQRDSYGVKIVGDSVGTIGTFKGSSNLISWAQPTAWGNTGVPSTGRVGIKSHNGASTPFFVQDYGNNPVLYATVGTGGLDGKVGIGTTSPSEKLHVSGSIRVDTGDRISMGSSGLSMFHSGTYAETTNYTGDFVIRNTAANKDIIFKAEAGTGSDVEIMRIDGSSGNVGIGTTSPSDTLQVNGTFRSNAFWTASNGVSYWGNGSTAYGGLTWDIGYATVYSQTGNMLHLGANGASPDVTIDTSGNVGIGTTTPDTKFQVEYDGGHTSGTISLGNAAIDLYNPLQANTDEKGSIITFSDNYYDGTLYHRTTRAAIKGGTDTTGNTANGFLAFYTDADGANSAAERMRIDSSGNVGIGTTSPAAKLDISDSNSNIAVFRTTNANADLYLRASGTGSDGKVGIRASNNNLSFISNGATQASFNGVNFGIGTTSPSAKLHVDGETIIGGGSTTGPVKLKILGTGNRGGSIRAYADGFGSGGLVFNSSEGLGGTFQFIGNLVPYSYFGYNLGSSSTPWGAVYTRRVQGRNNTSEGDLYLSSGTTSNEIQFQIAGTEYARLHNDGSFGIGTTSPSAKLDVVGLANINDGSNNVMISSANTALTTGSANSSVGYNTLKSVTSGSYNSAFGSNALESNLTGVSNSAFGTEALRYNTGANNTAFGTAALRSKTSGDNNSAFGVNALYNNLTGSNNIAIGRNAGYYNTGNNNALIGYYAGHGASGASTFSNATAVGYQALYDLTTGVANTAVGYQAGTNISTGGYNTIFGYEAGHSILGNSHNTFIGRVAGKYTTGGGNTFIGSGAGTSNTTGQNSVFVGYQAGFYETGSNKLYISNSDTTTPLIYGEFDNDILRVNGTLQVGDPAGTGFALPSTDGTANQVLSTDGAGAVTWVDQSGGASTGAEIGFAYKTTDQTLTGTFTAISGFDGEFFDDLTSFDTTTGALTITDVGHYLINIDVMSNVTAGTGRSGSEIYLEFNGSEVAGSRRGMYNRNNVSGYTSASITFPYYHSTGTATFKVMAAQTSGTDTVIIDNCTFSYSTLGGTQGPQGVSGDAFAVSTESAGRTLVAGDHLKYLRSTSATAVTFTVPPQSSVSWVDNAEIVFEQAGAGQITIAAGSGVTINSSETLKSSSQHAVIALKRVASDTWTLTGERELL